MISLIGFALTACGPGNRSETPPENAANPPPSSTTANSSNRTTQSAIGEDAFSELPAPYNDADYSLGRRTFKFCGSCHTVREGGPNLVGPNLHRVIGRQAGTLDDFRYSDVLAEADFAWTPARLEEWLANPKGYLPGNNMTFAGVHRPRDRHAVIAYLMAESGYTEGDLPTEDAVAPNP